MYESSIYRENHSVAQKMRDLAPIFYNPVASMYHYFHMAQRNHRESVRGDWVWVKKYFYVLRPILAVNWLERDLGVVPTEFQVLVENTVESSDLRVRIAELTKAKKQGNELDYGPRIPEIGDFIDRELARLEDKKFEARLERQPMSRLNELFRSALNEVYG